jgi:hypothetical protein
MIKHLFVAFLLTVGIVGTTFCANPATNSKEGKTKQVFSIAQTRDNGGFTINNPANFKGKVLVCTNKGIVVQEHIINAESTTEIDFALLDPNTYFIRVVDKAEQTVFWQQLLWI